MNECNLCGTEMEKQEYVWHHQSLWDDGYCSDECREADKGVDEEVEG
jgi:predicted nucleic acid-binding Zn ribbon protein